MRATSKRRCTIAATAAIAIALAACGHDGDGDTTPVATSASPAGPVEEAGDDLGDLLEGSEEVRFESADGVRLEGRVFGDGDVGVVLAHGMSPGTGQADWFPFAPALADRGFRVLTFNFRGFCPRGPAGCSEELIDVSSNWHDVAAAVEYLRERGSPTVFVIGASMGGIASLTAASKPGVRLAGVISLASPQWPSRYYGEPPSTDITPSVLRAIAEPKLFVAGEDDTQANQTSAVRFAREARSMYRSAEEPKELAVLPSALHSSQLLTGPVALSNGQFEMLGESDVADMASELLIVFMREHA